MKRRPRVVIGAPLDISGHALRMLRVADELRTQGADVCFIGRGKWQNTISLSGFEVSGAADIGWQRFRQLREFPQRQTAHEVVADFRQMHHDDLETLRRARPDAVLVDNRWTLAIAAEGLGLPCIVTSNLSNTWMLDCLPTAPPYVAQLEILSLLSALVRLAVGRRCTVPGLGGGDVWLLESPRILRSVGAPESVLARCVGPIYYDGFVKARLPKSGRVLVAPADTGTQDRFVAHAREIANRGVSVLYVGAWPGSLELPPLVESIDRLATSEQMALCRAPVVAGGIGMMYKCLALRLPTLVSPSLIEHSANAKLFAETGAVCNVVSDGSLPLDTLLAAREPADWAVEAARVDGSSALSRLTLDLLEDRSRVQGS